MIRSASGYGNGRNKTALTMLKIAVLAPMPRASVTIATAENAGFLISCLRASRKLLITERNHWIDTGGATRWNKTGNRRDKRKHSGNRKINRRIECIDFEQNGFQRPGSDHAEQQRDPTGTEGKANAELPRALLHHHAKNARRVGAERHANAKLLRALVHRKTHHAIKSDSRENEGDNSENRKERRDDAVAIQNFMMKPGRRSRKIDWKIAVELRDRSTQHGPKCVRAQTSARSDQNGTKLSNQIAAEKRHVKSCAFGLLIEWALHQGVRNDSNDRAPRLRLTG